VKWLGPSFARPDRRGLPRQVRPLWQ